jgi:hypothetical protein
MRFTDISVFQREGKQKAWSSAIVLFAIVVLCLLIKLPFDKKNDVDKLVDELGEVTVALNYPNLGASEGGQGSGNTNPSISQAATPSNLATHVVTSNDPEIKYSQEKSIANEQKRLNELDNQMNIAKQNAINDVETKRLADVKNTVANQFVRNSGGTIGTKSNGEGHNNSNSNQLDGVGAGSIGGNLGKRIFKGCAPLSKDYNSSGKVVIKVTVDDDGKVTNAAVQSLGTNTADPTLRNLAIANAYTYTFAAGDLATGTITYIFKVK